MRLFTTALAGLAILAQACGSGSGAGTGTGVSIGGTPGGPYEGNGSSGPLQSGQAPSNIFGRFIEPGPNAGQASPGVYSSQGNTSGPYAVPSTAGDDVCTTACAKAASLNCPPADQGTANGNGANDPVTLDCNQECAVGLAELNTDCLRALYTAFYNCVNNTALTCHNGKAQAPACQEPDERVCNIGTSNNTNNVATPTVTVDAGRR
jgi:hypothetical protein